MKIIDEEKKKIVKEQAYNKYADIIKTTMNKEYYSDFNNIFSSFLALNMASEAVKKSLVDIGADKLMLEKATKVVKEEILVMISLKEKGILKNLIEKEKKEE